MLGATADRTRAFVLFVRCYDEIRRAVSFLRWNEGDADTLVPSLYAGRGGRGKSEPARGEPESDKETPAAPTPVAPVAGSAPHPAPVVIPGQPGGSPFLS